MSIRCSEAGRVVVVGAGISGVTAAAKLIHNGFRDVIVLEAQDYIGGRIKAGHHNNEVMDFGAQFLHGRHGNPLYEIANKLGRIVFLEEDQDDSDSDGEGAPKPQNKTDVFYTSSGQMVSWSEVESVLNNLRDVFDDIYAKRAGGKFAELSNVKQLVQLGHGEFMKSHKHLSPEKRELFDACMSWHCKYELVDNAAEDLSQLSLDWEFQELPGNRYTDVRGGMAGLLKSIADLLPPGTVRLNTIVTKICWDSPQADGSMGVEVTCDNGDVIQADHVIVTMSMGCLKSGHWSLFEPPLPAPSAGVIDKVGFGAIGKVFLFWEEPFWALWKRSSDYFENYEFLWMPSHPPSIPSDKCKILTKSGQPWWWGLIGSETVHNHPCCLEMWLVHEQAEISEHLEDQEVMDVLTEVHRAFLPHMTIPDPVAIYRTKWLSNPFTRGTYSHFTPGFTTADIDTLATPLPSIQDPRLMFAGEALHKSFMSAAHGAFLSGCERADRLLSAHGLETSTRIEDLVSLRAEK